MHDIYPEDEKKPIIYLSLNQVGVIICTNSGVIYHHQKGYHSLWIKKPPLISTLAFAGAGLEPYSCSGPNPSKTVI